MTPIEREILEMLGYGNQSSGFRTIQEKPRRNYNNNQQKNFMRIKETKQYKRSR
tara:strand:- start:523 stop:684 length:162 start_codon:yes stop_codon:yes gene_type:complete